MSDIEVYLVSSSISGFGPFGVIVLTVSELICVCCFDTGDKRSCHNNIFCDTSLGHMKTGLSNQSCVCK